MFFQTLDVDALHREGLSTDPSLANLHSLIETAKASARVINREDIIIPSSTSSKNPANKMHSPYNSKKIKNKFAPVNSK